MLPVNSARAFAAPVSAIASPEPIQTALHSQSPDTLWTAPSASRNALFPPHEWLVRFLPSCDRRIKRTDHKPKKRAARESRHPPWWTRARSEERRVGKEWRYGRWTDDEK